MQDQGSGGRKPDDTQDHGSGSRKPDVEAKHPVDPDAPRRPETGPEANQPPTTSRLRGDIDEGRSGDKVGFPDPAASPLGTDAEAGGTSPTADEVARAQANETQGRPQAPSPSGQRPVASEGADRRRGLGVTTLGLLAAGVVVIILLVLFA